MSRQMDAHIHQELNPDDHVFRGKQKRDTDLTKGRYSIFEIIRLAKPDKAPPVTEEEKDAKNEKWLKENNL